MNIKPEQIAQAKAAKTVEELLAFAKEQNISMTAEEAETTFAQLHRGSGALNDEELDSVVGGYSSVFTGKDLWHDTVQKGTIVYFYYYKDNKECFNAGVVTSKPSNTSLPCIYEVDRCEKSIEPFSIFPLDVYSEQVLMVPVE